MAKRISPTWMISGAFAVARHPSLWLTAFRQMVTLTPSGWWHRRPFLPVPDAAYMKFRMVTAYGGDGAAPQAEDLITYLRWCRAWPAVTGAGQNKY